MRGVPPSSTEEPEPLKIDPNCLRAALEDFFRPLRTNDTRADFFAIYRRESEEFDRDYARKYDEDLNTSLIFAGLFSAVSSAFIIDVQPGLEPDPGDINAAYMRVLIHALNGSLYPDADPLAAITWNGPAPEIVTVQCLLYASLATSLFAAFTAMLGKQWINHYIRNRGGSAAEKSWDRQQKLDGMERWYLRVVIEGLPVMLQVALVLFGCALSRYLWTINRAIAGVIIAVTLFGFGFHLIITIAAAFSYDCPFQTPPSVAIRALAGYISRRYPSITPLLRSFISRVFDAVCLPVAWFTSLRSFFASILKDLVHTPTVQIHPAPEIPLAVVEEPKRIFNDTHIDWMTHGLDARCVAWVLYSTTDHDVIQSSVRFAADIIWYPEIAGALSPHVLTEMFFGCFVDKQVRPGKVEQAGAIAMALASVLSSRLCLDPENKDLKELCDGIVGGIDGLPGNNGSVFSLVMWTLDLVVRPLDPSLRLPGLVILPTPDPKSRVLVHETRGAGFITFKLWIARVLLQTMWRWRRRYDLNTVVCLSGTNFVIQALFNTTDPTPAILKSTVSLSLAIGLGLRVDLYDTYIPDTLNGLSTVCNLLHNRLVNAILSANKNALGLRSILSSLFHVGLHELPGFHPFCFTWLEVVLDSGYPAIDKYELAGLILLLLHDKAGRMWSGQRSKLEFPHAMVLVRFLLLHEGCKKADVKPKNRGWEFNSFTNFLPHPTTIALRLLLGTPRDTLIFPVLFVITPALQQNRRHNTRAVALRLFNRHRRWFFWPMVKNLLPIHRAELLRAVGDPFDPTAIPYVAGFSGKQELDIGDTYLFTKVMGLLLALSSSDVWRDYLHPTNFASCDTIMAGEVHVSNTITYFSNWSDVLKGSGDSNFSGLMLGVNRLKQLRCHSAVKLILLSLWSTPITPLYDQEVWRWVERQTLELFSTRGEEHLGIFVSQIKKTYGGAMIDLVAKLKHFDGENDLLDVTSPFRVGGVGRRVRTKDSQNVGAWGSDCNFYTMCQLRRLYRLLGHDPTSTPTAGAPQEGIALPPPVGNSLTIAHPRPKPYELEWDVD